MDILRMLADLRAEQRQIEEAIVAIARLAAGTGRKRRGRPPKWMSAAPKASTTVAIRKEKRTVSAAARKRMSEAQRKRWAAKKGQSNASGS